MTNAPAFSDLVDIVDLETARQRKGVRLVVLGSGPSPWSEAAKALFIVKRIPATWVRFTPRDQALTAWTGTHNAPVLLHDDEPPRSHWSDIVMCAERLGGARALVPADDETRARMFGLIHEIAGEGGLCWSARAMAIAGSITSGGSRSFPEKVGLYLARKYLRDPRLDGDGLDPARVGELGRRARTRVVAILKRLARELAARCPDGRGTFFADGLSALDLYAASALWLIAPLSDEMSPMLPPMRAAATYLAEELSPKESAHAREGEDADGEEVPRVLLAHRELIYGTHLRLPLVV